MTGPNHGETWVYESLVTAFPGVTLTTPQAIAVQVLVFETAIVAGAVVYDLRLAAVAGTVAVAVAAVGSLAMLRFSRVVRDADPPDDYRRVLFGSSIEVVLAVLAFVALVTYLFVLDPVVAPASVVETYFGPDPPAVAVALMLLVLWDLCYRAGTSWWAAVVSLWRVVRHSVDPETARRLRHADLLNVGFGATQAALLPFVHDRPVLLFLVGGHVVAVAVVAGTAVLLSTTEQVSRP